ncbi:DUF4180 domain-containing protein [Cohnella suwonensis]|uniref:DUF4180 domain-containing protein n=1 Tax=Cohnella suwonensis TaxID=696072 RepID=A0ABW0M588_9BACL
MNIAINERGASKVAVVECGEVLISSVQDALDFMATVRYEADCHKIVIGKEAIAEPFFDLSTRLAGEILQKFVNYGVQIAIVGDFGGYSSKSLKDFIYESNHGKNAFFLPDVSSALDALHSVG